MTNPTLSSPLYAQEDSLEFQMYKKQKQRRIRKSHNPGVIVSYPYVTNYMPSPFEPSGWTDGANGTVTSIKQENPSGSDNTGEAVQTDVNYFTVQDSFSNDLSVLIGEDLYIAFIVKLEPTSPVFDISFVIGGSVTPIKTLRINAKTNEFVLSTMTDYRITELSSGYKLFEGKYTATMDDTDMYGRATFVENGSGLPAPVGSQCYIQASYFGRADDFPGVLSPTL